MLTCLVQRMITINNGEMGHQSPPPPHQSRGGGGGGGGVMNRRKRWEVASLVVDSCVPSPTVPSPPVTVFNGLLFLSIFSIQLIPYMVKKSYQNRTPSQKKRKKEKRSKKK